MTLDFVVNEQIADGKWPEVVQFYDTSAEIFKVNGENKLMGDGIARLKGNFTNFEATESNVISPDDAIRDLRINLMAGFGMVGSYKTGDKQKMIIYEYSREIGGYLESGTIRNTSGSVIQSFSFTIKNPIDTLSEDGSNIAISEKKALIAPGAKVTLTFAMGEEEFEMGTFYIDRSEFEVLKETIEAEGRSAIGKILKDQSVDENYALELDYADENIIKLLEYAGINHDYYLVEKSEEWSSFEFDPQLSVLEAIQDILKNLIDWKIEELTDGTIVIGSKNYGGFTTKGNFEFSRDKDIFSRGITRDDADVYRKVCVHTGDYSIKVFKAVETFSSWNLQSNKTLYVNVPDGTELQKAEQYAKEVAERLAYVGKIESFTSKFTPFLMVGDVATIKDNGEEELGEVTEVEHQFGHDGYYTNFTVDSGGRVGKGRLADYISKITQIKTNTSTKYE